MKQGGDDRATEDGGLRRDDQKARPVIPTVAFIGHSGSGKTVLITQLLPFLRASGYRVGTVKHIPDEEKLDLSDKDSFRHRAAGAERTLVVTDSSLVLFSGREPLEPLDYLCLIHDLVEGFWAVLLCPHDFT
jgi:molybdopterin-guanine dinucleotide biosynthesis protein MobB